jgi:hypothetical protein
MVMLKSNKQTATEDIMTGREGRLHRVEIGRTFKIDFQNLKIISVCLEQLLCGSRVPIFTYFHRKILFS